MGVLGGCVWKAEIFLKRVGVWWDLVSCLRFPGSGMEREYGRERNDDDCGSEDVKKFVYVLVL